MKSVKLKVALIANLIAVVCLVILGVITFVRGILKRTCNYP